MTPFDSAFRRYRHDRTDEAFREVVSGYLPMVYATALRVGGGDAAEAEDVAQMVFADLARKAPALREEASVGAWLHRHTCFLMKNTIRSHVRRRAREQAAAEELHPVPSTDPEAGWAAMQGSLDGCLERLREKDRRVLVLRFLEGRGLREVGEALGIGDDAAQKRVSRALDRLRVLLADRRTAGISAGLLGTLLTDRAQAAVPSEVAARMAGTALRLAGVRRGPLAPATAWTAGRMAGWTAAGLGIALGVWLVWPETPGAAGGQRGKSSKFTGPAGNAARGSKEGAPAGPEGVDSVLARLRVLVREPDTQANARAIAALIGAVPHEQLPALAKAIEDTGVTGILFRSFPGLLQRWGDHDTTAAMNWYMKHAAGEGVEFIETLPWRRALEEWKPANPAALQAWYAAAVAALERKEGPFAGMSVDIVRRMGPVMAAKNPEGLEAFFASLPDRPVGEGARGSLREDIRLRSSTERLSRWPSPFSIRADVDVTEAAVPTPAEYPALRHALDLPTMEAPEVVAENLQAWCKVAGAAPLHWAFAHLTKESAGRMLEEVIPVWAQHDPAGLREWYASKPPLEWRPADRSYSLAESIIRALAANDPVAATDFLVNQCGSIEVQVEEGLWSSMSEVDRDIAAGLTNADQCREVLTLLEKWPTAGDQRIEMLRGAAISRWKRWEAEGAEMWEGEGK